MQNIDLSGCQLLTDRGIRALASSCPNLEAVNISSCYELSDAAFKLLGACGSLRSIDACGCERLTDRGLQALARGARYALGIPPSLPQPNASQSILSYRTSGSWLWMSVWSWWVLCASALNDPMFGITFGSFWHRFHASWHAWESRIPRTVPPRVVLSRASP